MIIYLIILTILIILLFIILNNQKKNIVINKYFIEKFNNSEDKYKNKDKIIEVEIKKEDRYTAIIIEPREHRALEFVLNNFLENLSEQWDIIIFHGNKNINFINNLLNTTLVDYKNKVKLINLKVDNLTIEDYNNLLVSKDFYNYIPTEVFLIFQTDTLICNNYKDLIDDFIEYDYSGAPWKANIVGNGGLSLRRKSKMLEIIGSCIYKNEPEDVYFSNGCNNIIINKPNVKDAEKFSVEAIYSDISFGVHKPWLFMNKKKLENKNNFCNGLDKLIELNRK
jgi:hypothetical protein